MVKIIIAGPRDYDDYERVKKEMQYFTREMCTDDIIIVSGGCSDAKNGKLTFTRQNGRKVYGADGLGERLATEKGWKVKHFDADWDNHGISAGPIRNSEMADYATHSMIFWNGVSKGTKDMIKKSKNLIGEVVRYDPMKTEP